MSEVYTNQQASELLGVKDTTLRTWKSRKSDLLQENSHWIKDDSGNILWTETGLETLKHLCNGSVSTPETVACQSETGETVDLTIRYNPIIEAVSDAVAHQVVNRIDSTVIGKVRLHLSKPVTTTERVQLLSSLGLKPANPELLLQGNSTNYLPQGE